MTTKQHIVVDISDEAFVTEVYNADITGGIDISGLGRTIIRTDGTTEITEFVKLKNIDDNTIKITPNDIDISGVGNINMDTFGNAVFSCNNNNENNNTVTISSETIIIDTSNTGLHIKKRPRENGISSAGVSNNGDIIISDHGTCDGKGNIAGIIQFEASPWGVDSNGDQRRSPGKCGQIALTHEGFPDNDTWGITFNLLGQKQGEYSTAYEVLKLSGRNMVGICGKDPERNLDVSGSFRVTNSNNYLNIDNNGDIESTGNLYIDKKMGIGTSAPETALHIKSTTDGNPPNIKQSMPSWYASTANVYNYCEFTNEHESKTMGIEYDFYTSSEITNTTTHTVMNILSNNGVKGTEIYNTESASYKKIMSILSNGNVGIGTTAPANKLEVHGGAIALVDPTDYTNTSSIERGAEYATNNLLFKHDTHPWHATKYINTTAKISSIMEAVPQENESGKTSLGFFTAAGYKDSMSLIEKMRITSTGHVGIGTTNPTSKLHVEGDIVSYIDNTNIVLGNSSGSSTSTNSLRFHYTTTRNAYIDYNNTTTGLHIRNGSNNVMVFSPTGNIGIGTSSPGSLLDIVNPDNSGIAELRVRGGDQGTGKVYVGQDTSYGGGIIYQGDGTPALISGSANDEICLFRRDGGTDYAVLRVPYNSNTITTTGAINVGGNIVAGTVSSTGWVTATNGFFYYRDRSTHNDMRIGGWYGTAGLREARITNSTNLHIDSATNGHTYINHYSGKSLYTKHINTQNNNIDLGTGNIIFNSSRGISGVTHPDHGTIQTTGNGAQSWEGYSINGRYVFMAHTTEGCGIYNDINNEWMIRCRQNAEVELYHNNVVKLETTSSGVSVAGTVYAKGFHADGGAAFGAVKVWGWLGEHGTTMSQQWNSHGTHKSRSAYFEYYLQCQGVMGRSDSRIKKNIKQILTTEHFLNLIENIQLTEYDYIYKENGDHTYGYIAQQVKNHYADAIDLGNGFLPDEQRMIKNTLLQQYEDGEKTKWKLIIPNLKFEDNHTGMCKFYCSNNKNEESKCIKINIESDKKTLIFDEKYDIIFFYGKEVDDFHYIDKNKIYNLHHGAIQELYKEIKKIKNNKPNRLYLLIADNFLNYSDVNNCSIIINETILDNMDKKIIINSINKEYEINHTNEIFTIIKLNNKYYLKQKNNNFNLNYKHYLTNSYEIKHGMTGVLETYNDNNKFKLDFILNNNYELLLSNEKNDQIKIDDLIKNNFKISYLCDSIPCIENSSINLINNMLKLYDTNKYNELKKEYTILKNNYIKE